MSSLNPSSLLCALWMWPSSLPFPATLLYENDRQDLILHLIKAAAVHNDIVWLLIWRWGKILKSAKGRCPFCFFSTLCLSLSLSDTLGYFLVIKVSSCLASRTLSVACHGYRVSWSSHYASLVLTFLCSRLHFPKIYILQFEAPVTSIKKQKAENKSCHWVFCFISLISWEVSKVWGIRSHNVWVGIEYFFTLKHGLQVLMHALPNYQIKSQFRILNFILVMSDPNCRFLFVKINASCSVHWYLD